MLKIDKITGAARDDYDKYDAILTEFWQCRHQIDQEWKRHTYGIRVVLQELYRGWQSKKQMSYGKFILLPTGVMDIIMKQLQNHGWGHHRNNLCIASHGIMQATTKEPIGIFEFKHQGKIGPFMNTSKNVLWLRMLKWANMLLGSAAECKESIDQAEKSLANKGHQKLQRRYEFESII